jgi:uncharacterized RDD family membrane protein YckC
MEQAAAPSFLRRMAALLYDALLLAAILFVAAALATFVIQLGMGVEFDPTNLFYRLYLLAVSFGFFAWFWIRGGQTLGMRAWRLKVLRNDGQPLTLRDALLRYLAAMLSWAACGLGFLWILVDKENLAWHDRLSGTRLVLIVRQ